MNRLHTHRECCMQLTRKCKTSSVVEHSRWYSKKSYQLGANGLSARFVLAIKSNADGEVNYKARYVIGGHRDTMENVLVHGSHTIQASSARLLIALASIYGLYVWFLDVNLEYLQSTDPLNRRIFLKNPVSEFEMEPLECFELLKTLYGLSDPGDLWHKILHKHLTNDLSLVWTKADPSFYFSFRNSQLAGINGTYVDNLLCTGDSKFKDESKDTHNRFETSGDDYPPFILSGSNVKYACNGPYTIDQNFYIKNIEEIHYHLQLFAQ